MSPVRSRRHWIAKSVFFSTAIAGYADQLKLTRLLRTRSAVRQRRDLRPKFGTDGNGASAEINCSLTSCTSSALVAWNSTPL
jgi:hypothetical protein